MVDWKVGAKSTLERACELIAQESLPETVTLLDQAIATMIVGKARELGVLDRTTGWIPYIPKLLQQVHRHPQSGLNGTSTSALLNIHVLRNGIVHGKGPSGPLHKTHVAKLVESVLGVAEDWGVTVREGLYNRFAIKASVEIVMESSYLWGPEALAADVRDLILSHLHGRRLIAGYISDRAWKNQATDPDWPLVRCGLCDRLIPPEFAFTPQSAFMTNQTESIQIYCGFGCSEAFQAIMLDMQQTAGYDDPDEYNLHPLLRLVGLDWAVPVPAKIE
ncbi:MAG: hypothetical protein ACYDAB_00470 [bacterium]